MKATETLHEQGQSLWLDNITRSMLDNGVVQRYIDRYSVTGLTSNPSIFDKAIQSGDYDDAIREKAKAGLSGEDLFFELAIEDLQRAADLFLPIHERTHGIDGWCSLEVSPELAYDTEKTVAAAKDLSARAGRRNLFIKIPGTEEGLPAIEEAIAGGVPVNVTLLFDEAQYRGGGRRLHEGDRAARRAQPGSRSSGRSRRCSSPGGTSSVSDSVPDELKNDLGLAVGLDVYRAYRELKASDRWLRLENAGAKMQRLLWASTGTKDPNAPDTLYVHGLAAPFTINTMPDKTLEAFYDHGDAGDPMPPDGGDVRRAVREVRSGRSRPHGARREAPVRWSPLVRRRVDGPDPRDRAEGRIGEVMATSLRERLAWKALEQHHAEIAGTHLRDLFAADPARGERLTARSHRALPRLLEEPGHRRDAATAHPARRGVGASRAHREDVHRRAHQRLREPVGAARRAPDAEGHVADGRRGRRRGAGARGARPHERVLRPGAVGRLEGPHRQAHQERREHRHRWVRPRARDGVRGAPSLHAPRHDVPLRLERRLDRLRRGHARPLRRRDAVHHLVQDVHHARDAHERAFRASVGVAAARRRGRDREALRRGLDQRGEGVRVRHRHRQHVRLLGLGRWSLLDGLGDRPVDDARGRSRRLQARCSRASTTWTCTSARRRSRRTCR